MSHVHTFDVLVDGHSYTVTIDVEWYGIPPQTNGLPEDWDDGEEPEFAIISILDKDDNECLRSGAVNLECQVYETILDDWDHYVKRPDPRG